MVSHLSLGLNRLHINIQVNRKGWLSLEIDEQSVVNPKIKLGKLKSLIQSTIQVQKHFVSVILNSTLSKKKY